jgi:hypothetical protein
MGKQREAVAREGPPGKAAADKAASGPQPDEADHGDSVTVAIAKRARALRKKLNHVERLEQSRADGRLLNAEQEQALTSRPALEAALDELERLAQVVPALVAEERALAAAAAEARAAQEHEQSRPPPPPPVARLVAALYVSQLFGDGSAHSPRAAEHQAEREACLAWDAYEAKVRRDRLTSVHAGCALGSHVRHALTPFVSPYHTAGRADSCGPCGHWAAGPRADSPREPTGVARGGAEALRGGGGHLDAERGRQAGGHFRWVASIVPCIIIQR